jgi:hypothetical protein
MYLSWGIAAICVAALGAALHDNNLLLFPKLTGIRGASLKNAYLMMGLILGLSYWLWDLRRHHRTLER